MSAPARLVVLERRASPASVIEFLPPPGDTGRGGVSPTQGVLAVVVGLLLVVGVPVAFVDWSRYSGTPTTTLLCLALVAISAWRLTEAIALGRREVLRSMFYVFVYVFLAMPALAQTVSGRYPLDGLTYEAGTVTIGLVHLVLGVLAYEVGWALAGRRRSPVVAPVPRFAFSPARSALLGLIGVAVTVVLVWQNGLASFFTSRQETTATLTGSSDTIGPYYAVQDKTAGLVAIFLSQFLVFVALFAILYSRRHGLWPRQDTLRDFGWRLLIGALVVANVVVNNPLGNGRWWFCLLAVAFVSIYLPLDRPHSQRLYVAGALLLLLFSFAFLDAFRYTGVTTTTEVTGPSRTLVENGTYAMFQMELNGVRYVEDHGHTGGQQLAGSAFGFVPRSVWPDKPVATGQLIDPRYLRAASAWTEAQVDFGTVGVVVFFVAYGAAGRELTRRSSGVRPGLLHAVLPIVAAFQILLLRGSLMPAVGSLDQFAVAFAAVTAVHPGRRPGTGASS
jgi:hypothetical protein